jgi:hypothetical protein
MFFTPCKLFSHHPVFFSHDLGIVVKNFITTSPLRHRPSENMTRSPVPKLPSTTTYSPDSPWHRRRRRRGMEASVGRRRRQSAGRYIGLSALVCVFITTGPITKLFAWRVGDSGGHVLRETTSRGLCGLVCPSRTSDRGGEGDCVKEGGGEEGESERERALGLLLCHRRH